MNRTLLILIISLGCHLSYSQSTITGTVYDEKGETLIGTTVRIKGTTRGAVTDVNGKFLIEASPEDVLEISFVGFTTQEVQVQNQSQFDINLSPDVGALEEVVVIGYGTLRKSDVTGAVASLKPKEITNLPVSRTDQALQGRITGVNIQNDNASPNADVRIRIRGSNSLLGNNNPLIVVDGFQDGNLNWVHPNDIASIEVLKDASALAIYGAKGANGAVLVSTLSGNTSEEPHFNYSTYLAAHQIRNKLETMNAAQYARRQNQDALELGGTPPFSEEEVAHFTATGGTDWQDEIFRTTIAMNHHLTLSGGSNKMKYFISGDVFDQQGIVIGSEFNRYSVRANLSIQPTDKLSLQLNTFLTRSNDRPITLNSFSGENAGSPINSALLWSPTDPVFTDKVNKVYTLPDYNSAVGPTTDYNPVALASEPIRDYIELGTMLNGSIGYELFPGFNLEARGAVRHSDLEQSEFLNNKPTQIPSSEIASIGNERNFFAQTSYLASYNKRLANFHNFSMTALFEEQFSEFNSNWSGARGFISNAVQYNNLGLGQDVFPLSSRRVKRALRSFMTRLNYSFDSKYLLTFTSRWDASTVFGAAHKWAFFPSGAIGWNISREAFMSGLEDQVTNLKARLSYGFTGNQAIPPGGSIALIGDGFTYPIDGETVTPGIGLSDRASNPNLRWETTEQLNAGFDLELFNGRMNIVGDYYVKTTKDLLFERPVAQASGSSTQFVNVGSMENRGVELYFEGKPIDAAISWSTGVTFSQNKNKVLKLLDGNTELPIGTVGYPGFDNFIWLEVGESLGQFRGVRFDGIWQPGETEEAAFFGAIPGSPKAIDQNGDTLINSEDVIVLGNSQPDFSFGWNNTFRYKGLELNVFVQGVQGIDKLNLSRLQLLRGTGAELLDRWTPTNRNTDIPSAIGEAVYSIGNSDRFIEDASYIRIKNISLGYVFPEDLLLKVGISSARIYVSGYNLFTFTNYSGYDPESTGSLADFQSGVDLATFPEQKIYTLGLNIAF